jgi:signal transduction histidine kinase
MVQARSPGAVVLYAAYGFIALIAAVLVVALRMPVVGVGFTADGAQVVVSAGDQEIARLKPEDRVRFSSATESLDQAAGELVPDFVPPGRRAQISQWYGQRDALARMARSGPVVLDLPTGAPVRLSHHPRSLSDLSIDVWLLLLQGAAIGLLGIWLGVLKWREWGARMFMTSCLGVAIAAFSGAVFDARELTADGGLLWVMQGINMIGSNICATGLLGIYLCQPRRLAPPAVVVTIVLAGLIFGLACALGLLPLRAFYIGLIIPSAGFIGVLILQWWKTQGDPAARASLRWVGLTTLLGTSVLTLGMTAPQLFGLPSMGGDGMSFLPLFITYGGIAFGVGGSRLFDLDRWTFRILMGTGATFGLLALDAALISGLGLGSKFALAAALLGVGFLYLPLRALLWRWVFGKPAMTDSQLFQAAAEVAFTPAPSDRQVRWRALLVRLFDPLELRPDDVPVDEATIRQNGAELALPAVADDAGLVLRYRDRGRRLFGAGQQALARELVTLMRNAERTRDDYERGARDERVRIARDLHDDVNARLLTSLHRQNVSEVRTDVRKAMSEIRTIVSSLTGQQVTVEEALADMRRETAERLEVAGLTLSWPVTGEAYDGVLGYRAFRNLASAQREAISNILKHAGASAVAIAVAADGKQLVMRIQDNGRGLLQEAGAGNGLINMRQRLEEAGGAVDFPTCEQGFLIEMTTPVAALSS